MELIEAAPRQFIIRLPEDDLLIGLGILDHQAGGADGRLLAE